jgi:hypothetical protein
MLFIFGINLSNWLLLAS